jgi:colanic acid/amylovoran biosynthesis glycosyltransferase
LNLEDRTSNSEVPVVAQYCATFLKPEMLHIYRQITSLRRVRPAVIAQKRENADRFPLEQVRIVKKPLTHFLRRIWFKQITSRPWKISRGELRELMSALDEINVGLLHIYFGHIAVRLLPLIDQWGKPSIVSFHGADVFVDLHKTTHRRATEEMLAAVRRVLVRSESLRKAVVALGCAAEKVEIQRTGIPLEDFEFRERNASPNGIWPVLQACRLIEKKGLVTTLRAFAKFHQVFPESALTIAGEGPQLQELQALARELGIASAVSFPGFVSQYELRDLFYSSQMFLHPSQTGRDGNQEGVPNSMLEAMATGLPIFATEHGGIPEAVENGAGGILVQERDDEALANAMISAAKTPGKLARMGCVAAEQVARNFAQSEQTRRLEEIYLREIAR